MGIVKEYFGKIKNAVETGMLKDMMHEIRWIYSYVRRFWKSIVIYTAIGMGNTVVSLLATFVSRDLVDIITGHKTGEVIKYFIMMIAYSLISMVVGQIISFLTSWISMRVDQQIRSEIFEKILMTDWESITKYHSGDLLSRWSSDTSVISDGVLNFIPNIIVSIFRFVSAFWIVIKADWTFAAFALAGFPVTLLMSRTLMRRMRNNNDRSAALAAKTNGFNQETFANIQTIKAFGLVKQYVEYLKQLQQDYVNMKVDFQKMSIGTSFITSTVGLAVSYSSYGWGIYRVWSGAITYGTMTQFLSLAGTLTGSLSSLTSLVPTGINMTTSARRLMDILDMPQEDYSDMERAQVFEEKYKRGGLTLKVDDVSYTYHTGTKVFEHASLEAHPHEIIALVGPSGEGKTTMLRLILSVLRPQEGKCMVIGGEGYIKHTDADGRAIIEKKDPSKHGEEIDMSAATRKFFAYVPQGNTMFSGTIAENMRNVIPTASDEDIINALKAACAWDFVEKLPDGINTKIGERGGGFSEGQAQRLSIARALLLHAPILLLDEATSALDVKTEREVLRNVMQDSYPRTVIVTTHRPTVLSMCERVYNIENKKCRVLTQQEIEDMERLF